VSGNPRALPILTDLIRLISFEIEAAIKENDLDLAVGRTKRKQKIAPVRKAPKDIAAVEETTLVRLLRQILQEERRKKGTYL
jgi:hypothetical protein